MTRRRPIVVPLPDDGDGGPALAPPRKQSNAQQSPSYIWNSSTQELIPILPKEHPDHAANAATITEAIRRWNGGTSNK